MFTKNQILLRCMILKNHNHEDLPEKIPDATVNNFYKQLCESGDHANCPELRAMAAGKMEPAVTQLISWSTTMNWYNGRNKITD